MSNFSDPSFDTVSQSAHVWFGAFVVFVANLFHAPWIGFFVLAVFAAVKEFWYDQNYESPEVRGSNFKDFSFYMLGGAVALFLALLKS